MMEKMNDRVMERHRDHIRMTGFPDLVCSHAENFFRFLNNSKEI